MSKIISCIVSNETKAEDVVSRLQTAGFSTTEISVLFAQMAGSHLTIEKNTKAPEGAAAGGAAMGVVGGVLGLLAGIGSLAIPAVGPFIAAGPIMAALSGIAAGAVTGGVIGAFVGLGIPELEAKQYENKLKAGNVLVSVHTESPDRRKRAGEVFKECGGEDISETRELAA